MTLLLKDVQAGDKLIADGGLFCIEAGRVCDVKADDHGELYVDCCGPDGAKPGYTSRHGLDGQEDEDGVLIGFTKVAG